MHHQATMPSLCPSMWCHRCRMIHLGIELRFLAALDCPLEVCLQNWGHADSDFVGELHGLCHISGVLQCVSLWLTSVATWKVNHKSLTQEENKSSLVYPRLCLRDWYYWKWTERYSLTQRRHQSRVEKEILPTEQNIGNTSWHSLFLSKRWLEIITHSHSLAVANHLTRRYMDKFLRIGLKCNSTSVPYEWPKTRQHEWAYKQKETSWKKISLSKQNGCGSASLSRHPGGFPAGSAKWL